MRHTGKVMSLGKVWNKSFLSQYLYHERRSVLRVRRVLEPLLACLSADQPCSLPIRVEAACKDYVNVWAHSNDRWAKAPRSVTNYVSKTDPDVVHRGSWARHCFRQRTWLVGCERQANRDSSTFHIRKTLLRSWKSYSGKNLVSYLSSAQTLPMCLMGLPPMDLFLAFPKLEAKTSCVAEWAPTMFAF